MIKSAERLAPVLALSLVDSENKSGAKTEILAAGLLTHQPGNRPYRLVIVRWPDEISVHFQIFIVDEPVEDLAKACERAGSYFLDGSYFRLDKLVDAQKRFAERLANDAGNLASIYHKLEPTPA